MSIIMLSILLIAIILFSGCFLLILTVETEETGAPIRKETAYPTQELTTRPKPSLTMAQQPATFTTTQ